MWRRDAATTAAGTAALRSESSIQHLSIEILPVQPNMRVDGTVEDWELYVTEQNHGLSISKTDLAGDFL